MSDELLTTALCWEIDQRISADYAHGRPSLSFYCPDKACLAKVVPAKIRNVFFRAPGRHAHGCRWEKEINEKSAAPGLSRPKPSLLLPPASPTCLGPGLAIMRRLPPTIAELRLLAERVEQAPIMHPGTLSDVVDAWCAMTGADRADHQLIIADHSANYATAFRFLPQTGPGISTLDSDRYIVFGAATVKVGQSFIFVTTLKKFDSANGRKAISIRVPRTARLAVGLAQLADASVTAFWHGPPPHEDQRASYFSALAPDESLYEGLIVKEGHYLPW